MMTGYQLAWDDSRTARIRRGHAGDLRPLAWLRISYAGSGHEVGRVDVYTHAEQLRGRLWWGSAESVAGAISFCEAHEVQLAAEAAGEVFPDGVVRPPVHPWALATVVDGS
jgi:hypothetical protein